MIVCIVTTLALSVSFPYFGGVVDVTTAPTAKVARDSLHFEGLKSIENYWRVWDNEGREVTFFPECEVQ